ncbi:MAG: hypothetical protein K6U11_13645 [bacterium]|nr:hypothetical protein [bacterium]
MRKWISLLFTTAALLFSFGFGSAQMVAPGAFGGVRAPFFYMPPANPFYAPAPFLPAPLGMPSLRIAPPRPLLAPMGTILPTRFAAATITIIFDPTLSVVNVSAVPIASLPVAPTAVATVPTAPAPTALATLLPALLAIPTGPPWTQTQTISTTTIVPTAPASSTGLTSLLPII